jgi:hypothetical protein
MKPSEFYNLIIDAFNKYNVEYMVVGGYAVIAHGYIRATTDMDIWVNKTTLNSDKIYKALLQLGYDENKCKIVKNIITEGGIVKVFRDNNKIDLIAIYSNYLDFNETFKNRKETNFEGEKYIFIGIDELIESEIKSGSPKDLDDAKNLNEIKKIQENNNI